MTNSQTKLPPNGSRVRIGIHTSIAGRLVNAAEKARELGCDGFQIFSASPRSWAAGRLDEAEVQVFVERRATLGLDPLVIHCNYLINLASGQPMLRARSLQAFKDELLRAKALQADYLVLHPGSAAGQKRIDAVRNVVTSLRQILSTVRPGKVQVLLENTAGQGSVLGADLKELAFMVDALQDVNVGACLDTAHLHGAGYDLTTESGLNETLAAVHIRLGLERVKVIHFNDSKAAFGSQVDRHENIGKGKIGKAALSRVLRHSALRGIPFILETPVDKPGDDLRNLRAARRLAESPPGASKPASNTASRKKKPAGKTRRKVAGRKKKVRAKRKA